MGQNKLFMLSSHGKFDTDFEYELENYKKRCFKIAESIFEDLKENDTAYIGYDGDSYSSKAPICYLFLEVLNHLITMKNLKKKNITVQPIVCQIGDYINGAIPEDEENKQHIENLLKEYGEINPSNNGKLNTNAISKGIVAQGILKFNDKFTPFDIENFRNLETIKLSYTEVGTGKEETIEESVSGEEYQIKINYGPSYKPKRKDDKDLLKNFGGNLLSVIEGETCFDLLDPQIYKKIKKLDSLGKNTCEDKYNFSDGRSDCYGGYTEDDEGNKKLVGSTAGWKLYLDKVQNGKKPLFSKIYYYPLWLTTVKEYNDSITEQIQIATIKPDLLGKYNIELESMDVTHSNRGGSRKLKRFIKKKSKRRTKSKKPLSKSRRLKKGKKRSRRRN